MFDTKEIKVDAPTSIEAIEHPPCQEETYTMSLVEIKEKYEEEKQDAG
jgi:hypothetical protein